MRDPLLFFIETEGQEIDQDRDRWSLTNIILTVTILKSITKRQKHLVETRIIFFHILVYHLEDHPGYDDIGLTFYNLRNFIFVLYIMTLCKHKHTHTHTSTHTSTYDL